MALFVVLDTNVIQEDFLMRSGRFQILFDYVKRTQSGFLLPQIVLDELAANYEREVRSRLAKLKRAEEQLNGITIEPTADRTRVNVPDTVTEYLAYVKKRLALPNGAILPYSEANLRDAIQRAIQRRPPCTDRGEEIRDTVLWNTLLEAGAEKNRILLFISKNTNQFSADKIALHPDLAKEAKDRAISIMYLSSLEEFAKQHASKIEFITEDWLVTQINPDLVLDAAADIVIEEARSIAKRRAGFEVEGLGAFTVHGSLEVDEFFVYAMQTGDFRIEITWFGTVEVEYEAEVESGESRIGWKYEYDAAHDDFDAVPVYRQPEKRTEDRTVDLSVTVVTDVIVEDSKVADWSIVDVSADG